MPRRQRVFDGAPTQRGELPTRVDVAVVDLEKRRWDSWTGDRVPFGMASDQAIGRLLAVCGRGQNVLRRRGVAQRTLVGDEVIRELHRV